MARYLFTNMDIETLRYPSWCLCRELDMLIGTKEEVYLRRKCNAIYFYVNNVGTSHKMFHSGSNSEGFNFLSSDLDLMSTDINTVVIESRHGTRPDDSSKTVLLMRREGCNPGFVILQLLNGTTSRTIAESVVEYHGHPVVSSLLYRDVHRNAEYGQVGHGPCNTIQDPVIGEIDCADCFKCDKWPTEANEFIFRHRLHGWPEKSLLDKIICRGCHLVPIGDKDPGLSHVQWRLSFSAAEKDLVHSFNHTQFLVYGLLKIFLKQFINKSHLSDGILCSYFLKTAIFYSIESTPSYLWREDLLIPCFWFCINKLIAWVEQGYCPNYFVPQNNMFRNKVYGQFRLNLLCVLNQCKRIGWTCIYLCEDLKGLQTAISHPVILYLCEVIPIESEREYALDKIVSSLFGRRMNINRKQSPKSLSRSLALLRHSRTQQEVEYSTILLYIVLLDMGRSVSCIDSSANNKYKYKALRKCQRLLSKVSSGLRYVGMFYMASFYHNTGQYQQAIHLIERVMSTWKPYALYRSFLHPVFYYDLYLRYVCGRGIRLNNKFRFAYVNDIDFIQREKAFYPAEIYHDIDARAPFPLFLPPLPYTVFLLFLCHHRLGNIDRSLSVLHDLEVLALDNTQGGRQYPVVYNMLAICLDKLGNRQRAVEMCLLSQELKPDRNGAERLLDKILSGSS